MGVGGSAPRPGRFTSEKDPVPWVGPRVRSARVRKISPPPTGIRSPDRPARSESLYRLSHPVRRSSHKAADILVRLLTKLELSRQIFEKYSYITFQYNPANGCRVSRGQKDMAELTVAFRNFANAPKKPQGLKTHLRNPDVKPNVSGSAVSSPMITKKCVEGSGRGLPLGTIPALV